MEVGGYLMDLPPCLVNRVLYFIIYYYVVVVLQSVLENSEPPKKKKKGTATRVFESRESQKK